MVQEEHNVRHVIHFIESIPIKLEVQVVNHVHWDYAVTAQSVGVDLEVISTMLNMFVLTVPKENIMMFSKTGLARIVFKGNTPMEVLNIVQIVMQESLHQRILTTALIVPQESTITLLEVFVQIVRQASLHQRILTTALIVPQGKYNGITGGLCRLSCGKISRTKRKCGVRLVYLRKNIIGNKATQHRMHAYCVLRAHIPLMDLNIAHYVLMDGRNGQKQPM